MVHRCTVHVKRLPCRGNLTATVPGQSLYKAPQTYLAQHPTAPPEEQVITTDPENVLLRVLKLSQKREGPKGKGDKGKTAEKSKRYDSFTVSVSALLRCCCASMYDVYWLRRPATEAAEGAPANKKHNSQASAGGQLILMLSYCTQTLNTWPETVCTTLISTRCG